MEARSSAFQALKPACIKLSQAALSLPSQRTSVSDVLDAELDLLRNLRSISSTSPAALDRQLADYIFFPVSHVLRQHSQLSSRVLETALECVLVLLKTSWRDQIEPKLGVQLLILLAILADTEDSRERNGSKKSPKSEELQLIVQQCFGSTLKSLAGTSQGREALLAAPNLPQLGKVLYEILESLKSGSSQEIQLAALGAVNAFASGVDDETILRSNFLPGLVSALQRVLLPTSQVPRSLKLLAGGLDTLTKLLVKAISDAAVHPVASVGKQPESNAEANKSWLAATSAQIRMVLATVVKLRSHPREEVQLALANLCCELLNECAVSLSDSTPFLLETLVSLNGTREDEKIRSRLLNILSLNKNYVDLLTSSLYNWLTSLPRIMQSQDNRAKQQIIAQISTAYQFLSSSGSDMSPIERLGAKQLCDSVASALRSQRTPKVQGSSSLEVQSPGSWTFQSRVSQDAAIGVPLDLHLSGNSSFGLIQQDIALLMDTLAALPSGLVMVREMLSVMHETDGDALIASFWSSLHIVRTALRYHATADEFLAVQSSTHADLIDLLDELYAFSLELIEPSVFEGERDWRLQVLALETVALQAAQLKTEFRNELVDTIYPVVHLLGSDNESLQRHAVACVNTMASACGYTDARDLVITNVDYLVNAIALKLNTFDISAQAPQVLLMIVKLTGPKLLPYLDDLIDSMFAALDSYQGYPKLVEMIFAVLLAIAQEGAKTEGLVFAPEKPLIGGAAVAEYDSIDELSRALRQLKRKRNECDSATHDSNVSVPVHPKRPWAAASSSAVQDDHCNESNPAGSVPASAEPQEEISKPPAPKTYAILLKISELAQHYLTSSSSTLRTSLLALLNTTVPAISKHENSFLPLVNTLWPVVVARLDDDQAFVVADALLTIACICKYAGQFMRSRIAKLWPELRKVATMKAGLGGGRLQRERSDGSSNVSLQRLEVDRLRLKQEAVGVVKTDLSQAYQDAPSRRLQEALVELFKSVVEFVGIDEDIFDEVVKLLGRRVFERDDLRKVLELYNADTVWLAESKISSVKRAEPARLSDAETSSSTYRWHFADHLDVG